MGIYIYMYMYLYKNKKEYTYIECEYFFYVLCMLAGSCKASSLHFEKSIGYQPADSSTVDSQSDIQ